MGARILKCQQREKKKRGWYVRTPNREQKSGLIEGTPNGGRERNRKVRKRRKGGGVGGNVTKDSEEKKIQKSI